MAIGAKLMHQTTLREAEEARIALLSQGFTRELPLGAPNSS